MINAPVYGEEVYADLDEDTGMFCVFGVESGFAYGSYASMEQAESRARRMNEG